MRALVIWLSLGVATVAGAADVRTIVVDEKHNEVVQPEGTKPPVYAIAGAETLRLDARKFDFAKAGYPKLQPNTVRVVVKDIQYFADWSASGVTALSPETLVPLNNAPKFAGFRAGDSVAVEIGRKEVDHVKRQIDFKVQWAAQVRVK